MPSIDLLRLRKQIAHLGIFVEVPGEFVSEYKGLLEFYHHWAHHQNEDRIPNSFMLMYDLPPQVIPEIELGLKPFLQAKSHFIFSLADMLRKDLHFECSALAAFMLGLISKDKVEALKDYLITWLESPLDKALIETIFIKATEPLKQSDQEAYLNFLQTLLKSSNKRLINAGLIGLMLFIPSVKVDNLPKILNMVSPLIKHTDVRQETMELLIRELALKSPVETGYLIRQVLSDTEGRHIETLARAFLQYLPSETAKTVAETIKLHALRTK